MSPTLTSSEDSGTYDGENDHDAENSIPSPDPIRHPLNGELPNHLSSTKEHKVRPEQRSQSEGNAEVATHLKIPLNAETQFGFKTVPPWENCLINPLFATILPETWY